MRKPYAPPKLRNRKVTINGETFASKREYVRWCELQTLLKAGQIKDLQKQVKYVLIPSQKIGGRVAERECAYIADFVYKDAVTNEVIVEDSKGYRDPSSAAYAKYVIKRKLMLERYGIRIREV